MTERVKSGIKITAIITGVLIVLLTVEIMALHKGNKLKAFETSGMLIDYAISLVEAGGEAPDYQATLNAMKRYEGCAFYIADKEGRVIEASFDETAIGTVLGMHGVKFNYIARDEYKEVNLKLNGEEVYGALKEKDGMVYFAAVTVKHANRMIWKAVIFLTLCFLAVDVVSLIAIRRVTVLLYREEEQSNRDKMTDLLNRKAYEANISANPGLPKEDDFVYVAMDLNELKNVNDTLGHEVGDDMIKGAAELIKRCFGSYGRVFRIGGDEFVAIIFADEATLEKIKKDFEDSINNWAGRRTVRLSISCGYAPRAEFPDKTVRELAKMADDRMYRDKELYYRTRGVDRRSQKVALDAICASYNKILRVNLTTDEYEIISMDPADKTPERGFAPKLSEWTKRFVNIGIHPEDREQYMAQMDMELIRKHFLSGEKSYCIFYRRLTGDNYRQTRLELIPTKNYSHENQSLYLYVKDIDK